MSDPELSGYDWDSADEADASGPARAVEVPPSAAPELKTLLSLAVAAIVIAALYLAKRVLISVTLAIMLSFVLTPLVNLLRRLRLGRTPSVILSVLLALGIIGGLGAVIASQAAVLATEAPTYAVSIERKAEGARLFLTRRLTTLSGLFRVPRTAAERSDAAESLADSDPVGLAPVLVQLAPAESSAVGVARSLLEPVLVPLETTIIVIVLVGFILLQKEDLRDRFIRLFGTVDLHRTTVAMDDAARRLSRYYLSQLGVNSAFGAVVTAGLWAIGVPSPALWGVIAALARFVPYLGALIAGLGPFLMAAAVEPGWTTAAYVALLFGVVEPLTAYAIEPFVYGHSTGLAPVSVVVAAVFWTWIWGPIGLILSTPLTLCLVVMGRHVKSLEFFDVLLGDRPALSPVQNFYQRILAGNPGEALDKAEAIIVDRSLESYYDEVVVGAMRLAAEDEARGMLGRDRMTAITRSVMGVIRDLDDRAADTAPARVNPPSLAPRSTTMVACVAGRGPFDEAVASMLHQLLTQRGTSARRIPASALVRDTDPQIDISDVSVVVLCSLALSDTTPRLERLVRRLRQRIPGVGVVLGLWSGDAVLQDSALQGQIGADRFVTSLGMAVTATSELLGSTPAATPQEDRQTGIAAPVRLATR